MLVKLNVIENYLKDIMKTVIIYMKVKNIKKFQNVAQIVKVVIFKIKIIYV